MSATGDIAATVLTGREYRGRDAVPAAGEAVHVISGDEVRELLLERQDSASRPIVRLKGVRITGDLDLAYTRWRGHLSLLDCRIDGDVRLTDAEVFGRISLSGSRLRLLDISGIRLDGALLFRRGGLATQGLLGVGATVSGALNLGDSTFVVPLKKPKRWAIDLFRANLGDVFLAGARIAGGLYANSATIGRNVRLQATTVTARRTLKPKPEPQAPGTAISLLAAQIGGAIYLNERAKSAVGGLPRVVGQVDLRRTRCQSLHVTPVVASDGAFRLDGLVYDELRDVTPEQWLALVERSAPASNQPYMFFAAHCQAYGLVRLRRQTLVAMQDRSAALPGRRWWERAGWRAWRTSVEYGYQPIRAIGWLALAAVLCAVVLAVGGAFLVHDAPDGVAGARGPDGADTIIAVALDSVLPFAGLGAKDAWTADPVGAAQTAWMALFVSVKFAGWSLAALGLASMTGLARRE